MMDTKRLILAVVLSSAVLFVFNFFAPKRPLPIAGKPATQVDTGTTTPAPAVPSPAAALAPPGGAGSFPVKSAVLENDRVRLQLSTLGGAVVKASLKDYSDKPGKGGTPVQVLGAPSGADAAGDTRLTSGSLGFGAVYQEVEATPTRVAYVWESAAGVRVEKVYTLEAGRHDVGLSVTVRNRSTGVIKDQLGVRLVQDYGGIEDKYTFTGPTYMNGTDLSQVKLGDLKKEAKQVSGQIAWAAMLQKYFLTALVPSGWTEATVRLDRHQGKEKVVEAELDTAPFDVPAGSDKSFAFRLYAGPKLAEYLAPLGSRLDRVIDYGWFSVIARPLVVFLKAIYRVTGNYGLAIIVLTVIVKAAFWPLSAKSFRSMQKMKDLQPKMQKLRERYAKDRERLNMEVMQLYKTHKVNPLGGCLPMLVQIPVFFALYRVLGSSFELRHAPFFLWITDLSAKDPYYVTPLIMGVSMFFQQKMTPATGMDPAQAKMMQYGMPAIFTFMFLNFASGLVLYWLVNNLLSILQQGMMMRRANAEAK